MKVLNKNTDDIPEAAISIDGSSALGNPYIIGKDGDRESVVNKYTDYLIRKIVDNDTKIVDTLRGLKDTDSLVCFCKPEACHGDVIINIREFLLSSDTWDKGVQELRKRLKKEKAYQPINDGIDHINIYSKGNTELGRLLSNFSLSPFEHPIYGSFNSVEGFWYYCATGHKHDVLKTLYGYKAKEIGRTFEVVENDDFLDEIEQALRLKLDQNKYIKELLKNSTLPLSHYYYYGKIENPKIIHDEYDWLSNTYTDIRKELQGYRTIIAGSRGIDDYDVVKQTYIQSDIPVSKIISGGAKGVDTLGERLALELNIPIDRYIPDWKEYGKSAGYIRNKQMADNADALIAVWDGESKGTKSMIEIMKKQGKKVFVRII